MKSKIHRKIQILNKCNVIHDQSTNVLINGMAKGKQATKQFKFQQSEINSKHLWNFKKL